MNHLAYRNLLKYHKVLLPKYCFATQASKQEDVIVKHLDGTLQGVSILSLNKHERKNALSIKMLIDINNAINSIKNSNIRVLIIKSNIPGTFCAGADLKERLTLSANELSRYNLEIRATMTRICKLRMPVLAAIDGYALGGGLELALSCDILVAAENAKLGLVETSHAIIPGAGGTARLPRIINPALAKELIFTAKIFDGVEAQALGVVNHAVAQNEDGNAAYLKTLDIAKRILPNGPIAVEMAKFVINNGVEVDLNTALAFEEASYARTIPTKDRIEGLKAFSEKRSPKYVGE